MLRHRFGGCIWFQLICVHVLRRRYLRVLYIDGRASLNFSGDSMQNWCYSLWSVINFLHMLDNLITVLQLVFYVNLHLCQFLLLKGKQNLLCTWIWYEKIKLVIISMIVFAKHYIPSHIYIYINMQLNKLTNS